MSKPHLLQIAQTAGDHHFVFYELLRRNRAILFREAYVVLKRVCKALKIRFCHRALHATRDVIETLIEGINERNDVVNKVETKFAEQFFDEEFIVITWDVSPTTPPPDDYVLPVEMCFFNKVFDLMFVNPESQSRGELRYTRYLDAVTSDPACNADKAKASAVFKKFVMRGMFNHIDCFDTYIFSIHFSTAVASKLKHLGLPTCWMCERLCVNEHFSTTCVGCKGVVHNTCLFRKIQRENAKYYEPSIPCNGASWCKYKYKNKTAQCLLFDTVRSPNVIYNIDYSNLPVYLHPRLDEFDEHSDEEFPPPPNWPIY
uniref:Phorbol-ester/DAG-type domain-containing protein n=1 Tax=Panagrellus redivivus TaxID=6233 RepID=A0A7E4VUS5_PANRE